MIIKKIISSILAVAMVASMSTTVFAEENNSVNESDSIQIQADALIAAVDEDTLMSDAMLNTTDYSVPLSIRESIVADASFLPVGGVKQNEIELKVNSTVRKIGEVISNSGDALNLYVAVAAATDDAKEEIGITTKHGIKAWAYVYWIDNFGPDNELYAAGATWDPNGKVVSNRVVKYGTTDLTAMLWLNGPTTENPTVNNVYYEDKSTYRGYVLRCQTTINVVNAGVVTCNVSSNMTT